LGDRSFLWGLSGDGTEFWAPCDTVHPQMGVLSAADTALFMIFVGKILVGKVAQKRFAQVWENLGKNPSHPQKFACSYTYVQGLFKHCAICGCHGKHNKPMVACALQTMIK